MFQSFKPIAFCDKFICLLLIQLKAESFRKSTGITLDLLIQTCGLDTIQFSQISVKDDLHIPYCKDPALNRGLGKVEKKSIHLHRENSDTNAYRAYSAGKVWSQKFHLPQAGKNQR